MAGRRGAVSAFEDHCEWTGASSDDREKWLISRRQGVGGSDVAGIVGLDKYSSALAVYVDKTSVAPPTDEQSEKAEWGQLFEPSIVRTYGRRTKRRVVHGGKLLRSKRAAHHLITLDGVQFTKPPSGAKGPGVIEVKTTEFGHRYREDIPPEVYVQIQWELMVTGAEWATCVWLPFPERRLQWRDVIASPAVQEWLADAVDDFWSRVTRRAPPDPDGSESSLLALRALFPGENLETIRIPGKTAVELAEEYERTRATIALLESKAGLIKNAFVSTMRESKYALLDDGRYWGSAAYKPRVNTCKHCNGELSRVEGFRSYTLREPRAARGKALPTIVAVRELPASLTAEADALLTRQLSESIISAAADPSNDDNRGAAE